MATSQKSASTRYLSISETADVLSCSKDTVRRMIARGQLRAYRVGHMIRIKESDLRKAEKPVTSFAELRGDVA